ncbi:histone deacetylase family protein [Pseudohalocynthiibacter aestuariivivens]|nr:histone deacetylase family protein [Pseudohalocynthiibacter aestuariivivens]QIE44484.1 histone deacetylase family protein [Pseudohalocynthiibacter aestuariivivens]
MQVYWSPNQTKHQGARFLKAGVLRQSPETPNRANLILNALCEPEFTISEPVDLGLAPLRRTHPIEYLDFLQTIHARWVAEFGTNAAILPNVMAGGKSSHVPVGTVGALGFYVNDLAAEIRDGTWSAVYASAQCAANAAQMVTTSDDAAYALCRPPGHHAAAALAMGFCFLNNAAIAAEELRQRYAKVAIVDIDVHHGNGTQDIFYDRADVLTASMHSDPSSYYPFHTGYEDECGVGAGEGFNTNVCFAADADDGGFLSAFEKIADAVEVFQPDAVVIALGLDALRSDPHGGHSITPDGYVALARLIRDWSLPTVFVQEGGYESEELGPTVSRFLREFEHG